MAQNFMNCQFCETSNETKWKCINCDLILCQECKIKLHTKVKKNENHKVVDLKEFSNLGASETIRNVDLKNIQCTMHTNELCFIYCQDCKVLSCAVCLLESHQNHKLAKIDEVYRHRVKNLQELDNKISQELQHYDKCEKDLKAIKSDEQAQYNGIKQRIFKRKRELHNGITEHTEKLNTELDKLWVPRESEISKHLQNIKKKSANLSTKKAKIEEAFQSQKASTIFDTSVTDLTNKLDISLSKQHIILSQTRHEKAGLDILVAIPVLKMKNTFTSNVPFFFKLENLSNGYNVMCHDNTIKTLTLKDNNCDTTNILKLNHDINRDLIIDMTVTFNDKLLFTTNADIKCLSTFIPGSKWEVYISISPFYARGIHATSTNILIGFVESDLEDSFLLTETSRRGIMIYDYDCRHARTIERDQKNQLIFSLPDAITTNINGDICVVDSISDESWEGRVVVLGEWGDFKWVYDGHPSINTEHNFTPYDIVTTSKGLILVTDKDSNAVHILSIGGEFVTCLNETHGIELPFCLNIDHKGQLLIGCDSERTKDGVAKLHLLEMSF